MSYGEPLTGALLVLFLSPKRCTLRLREALWRTLTEVQALQLLPPLARCLEAPETYFSSPEELVQAPKLVDAYITLLTSLHENTPLQVCEQIFACILMLPEH